MIGIKAERGTIAGGISVVMIFMTLCIAIYCLLSFMTAENELLLNKKNRDAMVDYYAADAIANKMISGLAAAVIEGNTADLENEGGVLEYDRDTGVATIIISIDMYRNLDISLSFKDDNGEMAINRYVVTSSLDWQKQREKTVTVIS